jgi:hypothetical protein
VKRESFKSQDLTLCTVQSDIAKRKCSKAMVRLGRVRRSFTEG